MAALPVSKSFASPQSLFVSRNLPGSSFDSVPWDPELSGREPTFSGTFGGGFHVPESTMDSTITNSTADCHFCPLSPTSGRLQRYRMVHQILTSPAVNTNGQRDT